MDRPTAPHAPAAPQTDRDRHIQAILDQFASAPPSGPRRRADGCPSRSRRHGYHPRARDHVWAFLMVSLAGLSRSAVVEALRIHPKGISRVLRSGEALVMSRAREGGFSDPDRPRPARPRGSKNSPAWR